MDLFGSEESQHSDSGKSNASSAESETRKSEHSGSEDQSGDNSDKEDGRKSASGESRRSPTPPVASGSDVEEGEAEEQRMSDVEEHSDAADESGGDNSEAESETSVHSAAPSRDGGESPAVVGIEQNEAGGAGDERNDSNESESEGHGSGAEQNVSSPSEDEEDAQSEGKPVESAGEEEEGEKESQAEEAKEDKEIESEAEHALPSASSIRQPNSDQEINSESDGGENRKKSPKRKQSLASSDEDQDKEEKSPKKKARILSDEEEKKDDDDENNSIDGGGVGGTEGEVVGVEKQKATASDLFGDDIGDVSSDEDANIPDAMTKDTQETKMNEDTPFGEPDRMEMPEEPEPDEPVPETRIEVEIPRIATNLGNEIHFVKLPNFLSVDTRPYDPQIYEDEIDEDEVLDEEGRARLKLKVENTIRWRYEYDELGNARKESNSRMVRWSDGSLSLHLGGEIFDVHKQSLMVGDHNHLFIRQGTGLQGQAVFKTKLSFRPHSTDSFTHRKMTMSLADRSQKTQKIRVLPNVGKDPEAHRSEMIKKEEDKLKASIRRENKQRRIREKSHGRGLSSSYLEPDRDDEEDDDGAISLAAIKNKYKKGGAALRERPSIYSSDEESGEEEREKRLEQAKNVEEDEDSDLDYFDRKKAAADGKKKTVMLEESDED